MNERGIFNIIGLCLLMVVTISIIGIHETEGIFTYNMADLQMAHDLKNVAESELIKAVDRARRVPKESLDNIVTEIPNLKLSYDPYNNPINRQKQLSNDKVNYGRLENVSVRVYAEIGDITTLIADKYHDGFVDCTAETPKNGLVLISVAEYEGNYQSVMAYVIYKDGNYEYKINYINSTTLTVRLKPS